MHELRYGELAHFKLIPHTPYYGTADATPLYLITLHAAWRATGDRDAAGAAPARPPRAACDWIDNYGDRDGDGFQEYQTRSPVGYENMGWKDSGDAMVYPDGTLVQGPEGAVRAARLCLRRLAAHGRGLRCARQARPRRRRCAPRPRRCSDASTRPSGTRTAGFYAYALDGEKTQGADASPPIPAICLWSGIVPPERAGTRGRTADGAGHVESGWGIRTLSAEHPAYNPYSYQNGSVWPHDNGLIALGFKRYGFAAEAGADRARHQRRREPLPAATSCRNFMPACSATTPTSRCSISAPTCRRPGRRARASRCCRRCWASSRTRRTDRLYVDPALPALAAGRHADRSAPRPAAVSISASGARAVATQLGGAARRCPYGGTAGLPSGSLACIGIARMPTMRTADAVIETPLTHGIDTIFALPGVHNDHLFDAAHQGVGPDPHHSPTA